eukprot:5422563-Amphidinium_carterae.2
MVCGSESGSSDRLLELSLSLRARRRFLLQLKVQSFLSSLYPASKRNYARLAAWRPCSQLSTWWLAKSWRRTAHGAVISHFVGGCTWPGRLPGLALSRNGNRAVLKPS